MTIAFIADIIGRPGRMMVKQHLKRLRMEHGIDFVAANYENASHGFGLTEKSAKELFGSGVDAMTGGNHTWDKKDILPLFDKYEILRPHNYPQGVTGTGLKVYEVAGERLALLNLMGHYGMPPMLDNAFACALREVEALHVSGVGAILIDMHAEASSEKRALMMMLRGRVSAIMGSHTHVGSDDFLIDSGTAYLSDVGLTGCRDNVIGMDAKTPIERFLTAIPGRFEVPDKCKSILQIAIMRLVAGKCVEAFKLKVFDDGREIRTDAWSEA